MLYAPCLPFFQSLNDGKSLPHIRLLLLFYFFFIVNTKKKLLDVLNASYTEVVCSQQLVFNTCYSKIHPHFHPISEQITRHSSLIFSIIHYYALSNVHCVNFLNQDYRGIYIFLIYFCTQPQMLPLRFPSSNHLGFLVALHEPLALARARC